MLLRFPRDERRSNRRFARSDAENDTCLKSIIFSIFYRHQQDGMTPRDRLHRPPGHEVPRLYDGLRRVGGADGRWTGLWRVHGHARGQRVYDMTHGVVPVTPRCAFFASLGEFFWNQDVHYRDSSGRWNQSASGTDPHSGLALTSSSIRPTRSGCTSNETDSRTLAARHRPATRTTSTYSRWAFSSTDGATYGLIGGGDNPHQSSQPPPIVTPALGKMLGRPSRANLPFLTQAAPACSVIVSVKRIFRLAYSSNRFS